MTKLDEHFDKIGACEPGRTWVSANCADAATAWRMLLDEKRVDWAVWWLFTDRPWSETEPLLRRWVLRAARVYAATACEKAGLADQAATLRALPDDASFDAIARAARAVRAAWAAVGAAWAADRAASAADSAVWADSADRAARAADRAARAVWADRAASAAWAASAAARAVWAAGDAGDARAARAADRADRAASAAGAADSAVWAASAASAVSADWAARAADRAARAAEIDQHIAEIRELFPAPPWTESTP
jgi:hypothetical protein